jgi:outer membrane murein-binding lipoprotein Lpp
MRIFPIPLLGLLLAGCASSAAEIKPSYVSPLQYQNLSCQQIGLEMERVSRRASEVAGVQDGNRSQDAWVTAGAIVLFWPAAFFIKGDGQTAAELARLKGEFEALERVALEKNCNLQVRR